MTRNHIPVVVVQSTRGPSGVVSPFFPVTAPALNPGQYSLPTMCGPDEFATWIYTPDWEGVDPEAYMPWVVADAWPTYVTKPTKTHAKNYVTVYRRPIGGDASDWDFEAATVLAADNPRIAWQLTLGQEYCLFAGATALPDDTEVYFVTCRLASCPKVTVQEPDRYSYSLHDPTEGHYLNSDVLEEEGVVDGITDMEALGIRRTLTGSHDFNISFGGQKPGTNVNAAKMSWHLAVQAAQNDHYWNSTGEGDPYVGPPTDVPASRDSRRRGINTVVSDLPAGYAFSYQNNASFGFHDATVSLYQPVYVIGINSAEFVMGPLADARSPESAETKLKLDYNAVDTEVLDVIFSDNRCTILDSRIKGDRTEGARNDVGSGPAGEFDPDSGIEIWWATGVAPDGTEPNEIGGGVTVKDMWGPVYDEEGNLEHAEGGGAFPLDSVWRNSRIIQPDPPYDPEPDWGQPMPWCIWPWSYAKGKEGEAAEPPSEDADYPYLSSSYPDMMTIVGPLRSVMQHDDWEDDPLPFGITGTGPSGSNTSEDAFREEVGVDIRWYMRPAPYDLVVMGDLLPPLADALPGPMVRHFVSRSAGDFA